MVLPSGYCLKLTVFLAQKNHFLIVLLKFFANWDRPHRWVNPKFYPSSPDCVRHPFGVFGSHAVASMRPFVDPH
jgi:hypothetical protein